MDISNIDLSQANLISGPVILPKVIVSVDTAVRNLRNQLLRDNVDSINPIRYAALTAEQQQELATYRQALLDVTTQPGWPNDITWPTKPSWM